MRRVLAVFASVIALVIAAAAAPHLPRGVAVASVGATAYPSPVVSVTTLPALSPAPSAVPSASAVPQPAGSPAPVAPPGTVIEVGGKVANPVTLALKDLQRMRQTTVTMRVVDTDGRHRFHTFTGLLLAELLATVRPQLSSANALSSAFVVFQGLGGSAIVAFPEFLPDYEGKQVLIAYFEDTRPLGTPGFAELVVPGDATRARFVTGLTKITVAEPGM